MAKPTQTIRLQQLRNRFSVFDHFVGLALKGFKQCQVDFNMTVIFSRPILTLLADILKCSTRK